MKILCNHGFISKWESENYLYDLIKKDGVELYKKGGKREIYLIAIKKNGRKM